MTNKTVMVCTPDLLGRPWFGYVTSLINSMVEAANASNWAIQPNFQSGCSLINYTRALMGRDFMASACDVMFFIDSDLQWDPKAFARILDSPYDVIGGVYPRRTPGKKKFPSRGLFNGKGYFLGTKGLQSGFLKITRKAMEKMIEAYPEQEAVHEGKPIYMLWDPLVVEKEPLGEDFAFCERWVRIGGEILIDPDIDFGHFGTFVYEGNLARELEGVH
jgi:hypothetical protein